MDVVKPDNLNVGFLREFMMLPTSYYTTGAAIKFRKIISLLFGHSFRGRTPLVGKVFLMGEASRNFKP